MVDDWNEASSQLNVSRLGEESDGSHLALGIHANANANAIVIVI